MLSYGSTPEADPLCDDDLCVHYVTSGKNKVDLTDDDANGFPDYVDTTLAVLEHVHDTYIDAGYREPKADGTKGGDARIDIYLGQLGNRSLYGYCTTDEPNTNANKNRFDRWSYCALDNDFSADEFGTANTPLENPEVTAAHEYFHATQAAYDYFEDLWLAEATATWVEDEMYDDVNDNLQYLSRSQLTKPRTSLDTFEKNGTFHYGTWSFFRFLTERYPTKKGTLPKLVLDIWRVVDGAPGGDDNYSWQGVDRVLRAKGTTGAKIFNYHLVKSIGSFFIAFFLLSFIHNHT
ncbi:MAG: MXAN_6640 family putative metalloprotease [Candidatus Methylacidiphilales bacterium]